MLHFTLKHVPFSCLGKRMHACSFEGLDPRLQEDLGSGNTRIKAMHLQYPVYMIIRESQKSYSLNKAKAR